MEALGKRLFITVDEAKLEEVKTEGVQTNFTPKKIKSTTATINFIGDLVTEGRFKTGGRIFIGEHYPEEPTVFPDGVYTVITEDSVISKL